MYNGLTEKMKEFCRQFVANGGNGTRAYLAAYDSTSETSAAQEASKLLKRDDIKGYINSLNKPADYEAIDEAQKIKALIWERIEVCRENGDDAAIARYTDQLNRLSGRYTNINLNKNETEVKLGDLDLSALKALTD